MNAALNFYDEIQTLIVFLLFRHYLDNYIIIETIQILRGRSELRWPECACTAAMAS
jgi:hypothetical protein